MVRSLNVNTSKTLISLQNLKYIGGCAFAYSNSLREINIDCPELTLSECSFSLCMNLTDININAEVIGERAFENCTALENVTFGEKIQKQ